MTSPPEPLIQIQNNFKGLFLIIPSSKIAKMVTLRRTQGLPELQIRNTFKQHFLLNHLFLLLEVLSAELPNHKNIGFLSNNGQDPLKNHKLPCQHSMFGHQWHTSETPFKWCFAGRANIHAYSGTWILPLPIN